MVIWMVLAIPFFGMQRYKRERIDLYNKDQRGKTVGLMCRIVEPIKSSGKCVTMDSGFNVSMGIVDMEWVQGVYGQALIKKRGRYWPKGVPGDAIDDHFKDKAIGHSETLQFDFDGHPFFIHCTKGLFICLLFEKKCAGLSLTISFYSYRRKICNQIHDHIWLFE